MSNKSWAAWVTTRMWLLAHPDKTAAIVTPEGTYIITFKPAK